MYKNDQNLIEFNSEILSFWVNSLFSPLGIWFVFRPLISSMVVLVSILDGTVLTLVIFSNSVCQLVNAVYLLREKVCKCEIDAW